MTIIVVKISKAARRLTACALALGVSGAMVAPAGAQEVVLKFATTNAPTAHLNREILIPWAEGINKAGKGVVRIDLIHGAALADHNNYYTRVLNDVVQVSWGLQALIAGKFPLSDVVTLPLLAEKSEHASTALWRLYAAGRLAKEYHEVEVLGFTVFPQQSIHSRRPIKSLNDVKGLKIRAGNKVSAAIVQALGGAPVSMAPSDIYQSMAKGTIDAVMVQYTAFQPFKLAEVTTHHVDAPLGASAGMVFMSRKRYDALPPAAKAIIAKHSGEPFTRRYGAFWDRVQAEGRQEALKNPRHTVTAASPAEVARHSKAMAAVTAQWVKDTPGGEVMLQAFREELARVAKGK